MLRGIEFNNPNCFDTTDENNLMDVLTKNTIIICEDVGIKEFLAKEICDICEGKHKDTGHNYFAEDTDELKYKRGIWYLPTFEIFIDNEQKIVLTIEAPYVFTANTPEDVWFAVRTIENKVAVYPIKVFKEYDKKWAEGLDAVYKFIVGGRYGPFSYSNTNMSPVGSDIKILSESHALRHWNCFNDKYKIFCTCCALTPTEAQGKAVNIALECKGVTPDYNDWSVNESINNRLT